MRILLTGGAGYIGSHTALSLLLNGYDVTVLDNFSNSSPEAIARVEELTGREVRLLEGDATNPGGPRPAPWTAIPSRPRSTSRASRPWASPCKSPWRITGTTWTRRSA